MAPWRKSAPEEQSALVPAARASPSDPTPMAAAAAAPSRAAASLSQGPGQGSTAKRKQASVVEMLEYVKGLDIDPIKESDMLWIAEEAFNAALPPGWSEHDDGDRTYFHNVATGQSVWRHPMHDLFREIVEYQRSAVTHGGFHRIEDEIVELEENIRRDLADWMELLDENQETFFYNRRTDESRFDDPRMAVYHNLYARIKMVAKMKERMPVLARAPRPEEPSQQELELRRRQLEEEQRYLQCLVKVQSVARVIIAKRVTRNLVAQATVQKGPQPLKGKLRLRMERPAQGGQKQLVLAMTTPHRRNRAAMKIQARVRGMLTRKHIRPLVLHRAFLSKKVVKLQCRARVWIAKRDAVQRRKQRDNNAAANIQRCWRGHRDRAYVGTLRAQKARYLHYMTCVKYVQKRARVFLERKRLKNKYRRKFYNATVLAQQQVKVLRARERLLQLNLENQPIQFVFARTEDRQRAGVIPWTWQLWLAPWFGDPALSLTDPGDGLFVNSFHAVGTDEYKEIAASKLQSRARGTAARKRCDTLRSIASGVISELFENILRSVDRRVIAATQIQATFRMVSVLRRNPITKKKIERLQAVQDQIAFVQAYLMKFTEQARMLGGLGEDDRGQAATKIQASWRGKLARAHACRLKEEALWAMKVWFEYTATGPDAVQVQVRLVPNPSFDDYLYFKLYGPPSMVALGTSIDELEDQLQSSIEHITSILRAPDLRKSTKGSKGSFGSASALGQPAPAAETSTQAPKENDRRHSARSSGSKDLLQMPSPVCEDATESVASPKAFHVSVGHAAMPSSASSTAAADSSEMKIPPGADPQKAKPASRIGQEASPPRKTSATPSSALSSPPPVTDQSVQEQVQHLEQKKNSISTKTSDMQAESSARKSHGSRNSKSAAQTVPLDSTVKGNGLHSQPEPAQAQEDTKCSVKRSDGSEIDVSIAGSEEKGSVSLARNEGQRKQSGSPPRKSAAKSGLNQKINGHDTASKSEAEIKPVQEPMPDAKPAGNAAGKKSSCRQSADISSSRGQPSKHTKEKGGGPENCKSGSQSMDLTAHVDVPHLPTDAQCAVDSEKNSDCTVKQSAGSDIAAQVEELEQQIDAGKCKGQQKQVGSTKTAAKAGLNRKSTGQCSASPKASPSVQSMASVEPQKSSARKNEQSSGLVREDSDPKVKAQRTQGGSRSLSPPSQPKAAQPATESGPCDMNMTAPPASFKTWQSNREEMADKPEMLSTDSMLVVNKEKKVRVPRGATEPCLVRSFFKQVSESYVDRAPPRLADEVSSPVPKPPAKLEPAAPPLEAGKTQVPSLRPANIPKNPMQQEPLEAIPAIRKTYGGKLVGKVFVKSKSESIDDLSEQEKLQVVADIERAKIEKHAVIAEKAKLYKAKQMKEQATKVEQTKAMHDENASVEEERRRKRAKELKKWLKRKEEASRARKARDQEIMQQILDEEQQKSEALKKVEAERLQQRERRLRIAEKQKAKLEHKIMMSHEEKSRLRDGAAVSSFDHLDQGPTQPESNSEVDWSGQISEAVSAEKCLQIPAVGLPGKGLPHIVDGLADQAGYHRSLSYGALPASTKGDNSHSMPRSMQASREGSLPQLPHYNRGLERALGSYADSGRPRRLGCK